MDSDLIVQIVHLYNAFFLEFISVCSPPAMVLNGNLNVSSSTVIYNCDLGFSLNGSVIRTCQEDGSGWNGTDPSCGRLIYLYFVYEFSFDVRTVILMSEASSLGTETRLSIS